MKMLPALARPDAPQLLQIAGLDAMQLESFKFIQANLAAMARQFGFLTAAISLFEFCATIKTEDRMSSDWQFVAARDGAMSIRNFAYAIANVRRAIGQIPNWVTLVDVSLLKQAHVDFEAAFPFSHKLRHSVAHPEFYADPKKDMAVTDAVNIGGIFVTEKGGNITINQGLFNNTFASTFEGDVVQYELSFETCIKILDICNRSFAAFVAVSTVQ